MHFVRGEGHRARGAVGLGLGERSAKREIGFAFAARGVQREKRGVSIVEDQVGAEILHRLILADRHAELDALLCIVAREFANALAPARPPRRTPHRPALDRFSDTRSVSATADPTTYAPG